MSDIRKNLESMKERFSDEVFFSNRSLSNEVGIHVFCYDLYDEMIVRDYMANLMQQNELPFRLVECDLYKIFLQICEDKRILKTIPAMEKEKGSEGLLRQLQKIASPEAFAERMQ